jgi:hypothetical protein
MRMMNEFEAQVLSDLSVLKTQMTGLMGDGNGGRIAELERRMERHEQNWQRAKGFLAAVSVVFAVIEVALRRGAGIDSQCHDRGSLALSSGLEH